MLNLNALDKPRKTRYLTGKDSAENFISRPRNYITRDLGLTSLGICATRNAKGTVMKVISRVRVPSRWIKVRAGGYQSEAFGDAEFKLGIGPCGKLVDSLNVSIDADGAYIYQTCGMEQKTFFYPMATITGRIEITMVERDD